MLTLAAASVLTLSGQEYYRVGTAARTLADGTAAAPIIARAATPGLGWWFPSAFGTVLAQGGTNGVYIVSGAGPSIVVGSAGAFAFGATTDATSTADVFLYRDAPNTLAQKNANAPQTYNVYGGNGGFISAVTALTELTTIAAAATTTTAIQIPANAVTLGVSVRVVTVIPTAATFTVTSATPTKTWNTVAVPVAANTTNPGTLSGPTFQTTASAITITPNLTPGAATGQVRVTIYYYTITPPSS